MSSVAQTERSLGSDLLIKFHCAIHTSLLITPHSLFCSDYKRVRLQRKSRKTLNLQERSPYKLTGKWSSSVWTAVLKAEMRGTGSLQHEWPTYIFLFISLLARSFVRVYHWEPFTTQILAKVKLNWFHMKIIWETWPHHNLHFYINRRLY